MSILRGGLGIIYLELELRSLSLLLTPIAAVSPLKAAGKRKAEILDIEADDFENVDPLLFTKRSKGANTGTPSKDVLKKPSSFILTRAAITPSANVRALVSPSKASTAPRRTLQPKSPAAKLNTKLTQSSPITAPAGRSPTHGKRSGILSSRRRTSGPYSRVDPPSFSLDTGAAPFSLDAALQGTIPSYTTRPRRNPLAKGKAVSLGEPDIKASWFFDIHEDSPEQEMTNLLQHGTCVLDISSDEESEQKAKRERDEGRDKENVPPVDDVSQTSARRATRANLDDMVIEKERFALGEMNTADYFADGCDETSVVIVPGDDEEQPESAKNRVVDEFEFAPKLKNVESILENIDDLMSKSESSSSKAAVLQPMEGTGDSFDLWESGSDKDETETIVS